MNKHKPVADIMTTDVYTADVDKDTLFDVKDLMLNKGLRHCRWWMVITWWVLLLLQT